MRLLATIAIWSVIALCVTVGWFALDLPRVDFATEITRRPSITLTASDGSLLTSYGDEYGETLSVDDMSPWIAKAVLAIEDRRFYQHWGVDPIALACHCRKSASGAHRSRWVNHHTTNSKKLVSKSGTNHKTQGSRVAPRFLA